MGNIKLRNNVTGAITEKSEVNWKNLPNDRKAQYTVVDGEGEVVAPVKNFSPPELQKKETAKAEVKTEEKSDAPADETQEQQVIRLHGEGKTNVEIGKIVGAHFKTVEKILKNANK